MNRDQFTEDAPGTLVPLGNTTADATFAFVPNPLPPNWAFPADLYPLLIEARTSLAALDGIGKHLPNPEILLRPIQRREAQLSSQLEGTITDAAQQALFQADPQYPTSSTDPINAYREIFNYGRALRMHLDRNGHEGTLPLSKRLIRDLHGVLMDGVRGQQQAGQFRTTQNQINHPARFVPPPPQLLEGLLDDFERYLNAEDQFDPLVRAFLAHYQFETIHPFSDGNGRVGRLLLALTIAEWCKLSNQWLYMSAFYERRKSEYMDLLLRVSTHGSWDLWTKFCLEGVVSQARDTERRCERLLELHRDFHGRIKGGGSVRLSTIVDALFDNPVIQVTWARQRLGVTYPTARQDLRKLERLGILQPLSGTPTLTYYCNQIFDITHADMAD